MLLGEVRPPLPQSERRVTPPVPKHTQYLGTGIQAIVHKYKNRPNTVIKINLTLESDPYEQFLRLILNHQNNPFFPRIYAVKKYPINRLDYESYQHLVKTSGGTPDFMDSDILDNMDSLIIVVMEKLIPLEKIDPMVIKGWFDMLNVVDLPDFEKVKKFINSPRHAESAYHMLAEVLNDASARWLIIQNTKHPKLKDALRLLGPLFNRHRSDIHDDNIMARLTSTGPQLVITDPIWTDEL